MSFINKIITQKVVNEAKQLYLNGDIEGANQKLTAHLYKGLYQNAEGIYLLSKINLENTVHLSDQKEIVKTFKFYEQLLQRAIKSGYPDAKTLYAQYYDGFGNPKFLDKKEKEGDSSPGSVSEYDANKYSRETIQALEDYIFNYLSNYPNGNKGSNLPPDLKRKINKIFPSLDTSQVIFYNYNPELLRNKWFALTPTAYYDAYGIPALLIDVVKTESYLVDEYRGRRMRFFYRNGRITEHYIKLNHDLVSGLIEKLNNAGPYLTDVGRAYAQKNNYDKAYQLYMDSAVLFQNSDAQNNLGILYKNGNSVEKNIEKALYWYELAANQDNVYAQSNLGAVLREMKQYDKAIYWLRKATGNGSASAANILALCYLNAEGVDFDLSEAIHYFEIAADGNNHYADYNLGKIYTYQQVNYEKAFIHHQKAAQHNHKGSLLALGLAYEYGRGVDIDIKKAIEYFDKAISLYDYSYAYANKGYVYATALNDIKKGMEYYHIAINKGWKNYSQIANIYMDSEYNSVDYTKAIEWLNKGIESNQAYSTFKLALMYMDGIGVEKNYDKAYELLSNANNGKEMSVLAALGQLYIEGKGAAPNPKLGCDYLDEALKRNNSYAKYYMGCAYITGNFVEKNIALGVQYLLDLHYLKGDSFADKADQKLSAFLLDPKSQLAENCNSKTIVELCHIFNLHSSPERLFDLYHNAAQKSEQCPAEVYALLAKNYHFGIHTEVDYEKAVSCYEQCISSIDYKYNSEIEFHYASLCFEGKGTEQDFIYGFHMAKAIGAYDSQCPDNAKVYLAGKEKFISLIVQYIKGCKQYQYIQYAASLVDLKKPLYSKLREAVTARQGRLLFEEAMKLVKECSVKDKEDEATLDYILSHDKTLSSLDFDIKKSIVEAEKTARECEIVETLLRSADLGYFPAIEYLEYHYFDEPSYLDVDTRNIYLFKLMKYHSDDGIFEQAFALRGQYEGTDSKPIIWKLRELIVSRNREGELFTKALELVFDELSYDSDLPMPNLDDAYLEVLANQYCASEHYQKKYKKLASILDG